MTYLVITLFFCIFFILSDVKSRKLPNEIILLFLSFQLIFLVSINGLHLTSFVMVFFFGFLLYFFRIIAAGDVKLASIMSMAVEPNHLVNCLLFMALLGGVQAVYYIMKHYWFVYRNGKSNIIGQGLPYGVPICVGFYIGMLLSYNY